ncbi:MAG: hypothetical protein ACYDH4_12080 [Candidatus Cryosericum sp.]
MRTANEIVIDNEEPLELSAAMRTEVSALLAPMDRSLSGSITAAITVRRSHRRLLQGLWLGLSPVIAVAIVAVLYAGGAILPRWLSPAMSQRTLMSPNPEIGIADSTMKGLAGSEGMSALGTAPSFMIVLDGDVTHRQLLVTWLRARHAGAAAELDNAVPGQDVFLTLEPDEVWGFSSLMALHGYSGEDPSGLRILPRSSSELWSSSLAASSLFISIVP